MLFQDTRSHLPTHGLLLTCMSAMRLHRWWGAQGGAANNHRMMMIGWVGDYGDPVTHITYTRLSALREVNWDVKTQNLVA